MKVELNDLIKMFKESISDDSIVIENYQRVISILSKVQEKQAKVIFEHLVENHETSIAFAKRFQTMFKIFTKQAKRGSVNPVDANKIELLQKQSEELSKKRSDLELKIGMTFLEKGFIDKKTFEKYYG